MGSGAVLGLSYNYQNKITYFAGIYQSRFDEAKNRQSPLLVKKDNTSFAIGLVWWFYQSERQGSR
jgi:hypothetical protein